MTVITKQPVSPIAHLTPEDIEQIGYELDTIRQSIIDDRGEKDAAYIRKVIDAQRTLNSARSARATQEAQLMPSSSNRMVVLIGS